MSPLGVLAPPLRKANLKLSQSQSQPTRGFTGQWKRQHVVITRNFFLSDFASLASAFLIAQPIISATIF